MTYLEIRAECICRDDLKSFESIRQEMLEFLCKPTATRYEELLLAFGESEAAVEFLPMICVTSLASMWVFVRLILTRMARLL